MCNLIRCERVLQITYISALLIFIAACSSEKPSGDTAVTPTTEIPVIIVEDDPFAILSDLGKVAYSLEKYKMRYRQYPISPGKGTEWGTLYTRSAADQSSWIEVLLPEFIPELPVDPRNNDEDFQHYMYLSNGANYKLIAVTPSDFREVTARYPNVIDPVRPGSAYGYWTLNARAW